MNQVQRVTDLIAEISAASHEQSEGITQVGEAVQQLDQVTQQNAALVEESAAAAASLKGQAEHLSELVRGFTLAADAGPGPASAARIGSDSAPNQAQQQISAHVQPVPRLRQLA